MTILAQHYLGNLSSNPDLQEQVHSTQHADMLLEVHLQDTDRAKGRIHAHTTTGEAVGIIKGRDRTLREGDVFKTENGQLLLIHLNAQKVMVLSFSGNATGHELALIHLGHTLGNHHWSILVKDDRIYVEMAADPIVMETTIKAFNIPGLQIDYESNTASAVLSFSHHSHH
jgi:urease accessory protein